MDGLMARVTSEITNDNATKFRRDVFIKALQDDVDGVYTKGYGAKTVSEMVDAVKNIGYIQQSPGSSGSVIGRAMLPVATAASGAAAMMGSGGVYMPVMATGLAVGTVLRTVLETETGRKWVASVVKQQGGKVSQVQIEEMFRTLATGGAAGGALQGLTSRDKDVPASVYGINPGQITIEKRK
jgi:hypothetical protein